MVWVIGVARVVADAPAVAAALDAMRLPGRSFCARMVVTAEPRRGKAEERWAFDLYARPVAEGRDATFDVVLHALEPEADRGKRILFTRQACWLRDPKAKRPVKIAAQQLWSQGSVSDLLTWSLARDFTVADGGAETIVPEGGEAQVACRRYDFTPRPDAAFASGPMRYWLDAKGLPVQLVHLTASGKPWRTVRYVRFQEVLGARRPVAFDTRARAQVFHITLDSYRAVTIPPACVGPDSFGDAPVP